MQAVGDATTCYAGMALYWRNPMLRRRAALAALAAAAFLAAVPAAQAQYFGQNKVQYRKFDFQVLKTEHFDIYYYPEEREAIEHAALMAERWYTRLSKLLL